MTDRPTALILSFSPIVGDARVRKQVARFQGAYDVTTCGYGDAPEGVAQHLRVPDDARVDRPDPGLLRRGRYDAAYRRLPGVAWARRALRGRRFDLIIANDVETVPLAVGMAPRFGVIADLHEYAPRLHDDSLLWRSREQPFLEWLCRRWVTRADAWSTVSQGLVDEYERAFGFRAELVTNATPWHDLSPTPVETPLRLVHSGAGLRNRHLREMAEAVERSRADVTLDFYLTPNHPDYIAELKAFAEAGSGRVRVCDPVPYERLVEVLNGYDAGLFVLPPVTFNYRWALPNKVFDFVQARLGMIVGPSPEMARFVIENHVGAVAADFTVDATREAIDALTPDEVAQWKKAANDRAEALSSQREVERWWQMAERLRARAAAGRARRPGAAAAPRVVAPAPRPVHRRLVLLTNEFPIDRGDASFIGNELDALAAAYDEVLVFNYPSDGDWRLRDVPENVVYGGSLKEGTRAEVIRRLVAPSGLARLVQVVWTELRHGRVGRKVKPVLITAAAAVIRAAHPRLRRALREAGVRTDVYAYWGMGAGMAVAALPAVSGRIGMRLHRYDLYEEVNGWLPLRGTLLTRPDVLWPISDDGAAYLRERYPWRDLAPITVARLGTIDRGVGPGRTGTGPLTVVSCSAITPVKRVDLLARAVGEISRRRPVRWVHFGDGPQRAAVQAVLDGLDAPDLAVELRGQTPNDDILAFYVAEPVDVFVNVSTNEGVPVSIMEAMSAGIPVVATRVGGVGEIVSAQLGSGEAIAVDTPPAQIADAIARVAADTALRPRAVWERMSDAEPNTRALLKELTA